MTSKNFISLHGNYVCDENRINPLFNNAQECFDDMMQSMVQRWYERLTNDARTAIKTLNFNPTVITGMMFFTDDSMNEQSQYFGSDYEDIATEMQNFALSLSLDDDEYVKCQSNGHYIYWYSRMAQAIRWYKSGIEDIEKMHYLTLSILPCELKEKVIDQIVSTDPVCQQAARNYYEALEEGRKEMLRKALKNMRDE